MEKELIAIMCPYCGDIYTINPLDYYEDEIWFMINETDCWACKKLYYPILSAKIMDEFVYNAFRRCKMD